MPLRDHFRPPLDDQRSWDGLHGAWPAVIVMDLNRRLPPQYVAEPRVHLGSSFEIDVAASETGEPAALGSGTAAAAGGGGAAAAVWTAPNGGPPWRLETWAHALAIGRPLPTLPLWLASDLAVPLELEASYEEACRILRIA